jgi:hypothetical protein
MVEHWTLIEGQLVKFLSGLSPIITYAFRGFSQSLQETFT